MTVAQGCRRFVDDGFCILATRLRFSSEERFIGGKIGTRGEAEVSGNNVADRQVDDITRNQIICLDCGESSITYDFGHRRSHCLKRLDRLLGTVVLEESNDYVQDDDSVDDTSFDKIECCITQDHGNDQDKREAVGNLADKNVPPGNAPRRLKFVAAILFTADRGLTRSQASSRRCQWVLEASKSSWGDSLHIRPKQVCNLFRGHSMGPVCNIVYIVAYPSRKRTAFMFLFCVLGASSNRIVFSQEHNAPAG